MTRPALLEDLRTAALARGASDAAVLAVDDLVTDPRVRFKCLAPTCYLAGGSAHCPPHGFSLAQVREVVAAQRWALMTRIEVPAEIMAARGLTDAVRTGIMDADGRLLTMGLYFIFANTLLRVLQQQVEERGWTSHAVFGGGSCKDILCHFHPTCRKLHARSACRHPDLAAPSLEACGFDAFTMAARAGWPVYPIGGQCEPRSVGCGSVLGLLLIGPPGAPRPAGWPDPRQQQTPAAPPLGRNLRDTYAALHQAHSALGQTATLLRDRRLIWRIVQNLAQLKRSWPAGLAQALRLLEGRPQKARATRPEPRGGR